jgi:putative acetyltransferase
VSKLSTSTMSIRNETAADIPLIRELNRRAFGRDDEADLVDRLRDDGAVIGSMAALQSGHVVGHILFSKVRIERDDDTVEVAALGPMAVDPDHQGGGIGSLLIMRGLDLVRRRGFGAVLVVGYPDYYTRFGFSAEPTAELDAPYSGDAFMGLELEDDVLSGGGKVIYAPAFADVS